MGRIVAFGPDTDPSQGVGIGTLVGVRFLSRVCHECDFCTTDREQHCAKGRNHLHHEDGSFQEYCVLDMNYLTVLPEGMDEKVLGPVLCAGVTAYKVSTNSISIRRCFQLTVLAGSEERSTEERGVAVCYRGGWRFGSFRRYVSP